MHEYRKQIEKGLIQQAYRGLMEYFSDLRTHFQKRYPETEVSGSVYFGYMDMTYFAIIPAQLKQRKLKIAIVFLHEAFRFEVWLSGYNRQVQAKYWRLIRESGWSKYRLVADPLKADAILEHVLVENPDFSDPGALTDQIEKGTRGFIDNISQSLMEFDQVDRVKSEPMTDY
jgi:hypothetical protein